MQYWIDVLNQGLIIATLAMSLSVILGAAGQLSIAPAGLAGVGGYLAAYLAAKHGWSLGPALVVGIGASTAAGIILGAPALRLGEDYLILLTLSFATIIVALINAIPALGGIYGLQVESPSFFGLLSRPEDWLRLLLVVAAVSALVCWRISVSPFGRVLRGIREDADATSAVGKNVVSFKLWTFAITSSVAGAAGVMTVYYNFLASPAYFSFPQTTLIVAAVIVGGMSSLLGSFVGALLLVAISPVLQKTISINPDRAALWELLIYGLLLAAVVRLRPDGLFRERWLSRSVLPLLEGRSRRRAPAEPQGDTADAELAHGLDAELSDEAVLLQTPATTNGSAAGEAVLVATGLTKSFGGIRAVRGLDLELTPGRITALVGPNGAGKTTVFNVLTGRIRLDEGKVVLRGRDITGTPPHKTAALGMVRSFQDVRTFRRLTLLDNVALGVPDQPGERLKTLLLRPGRVRKGEKHVREEAMRCLAFVGLEGRADELAGTLGYGDQKLLAIARALGTGADVLLVDEPAAGIDRGNLEPVLEVMERLRDQGKTICLVEHNLEVVTRLADHVFFMEEGAVTAQGTMSELMGQERLAQVYFGHVHVA